VVNLATLVVCDDELEDELFFEDDDEELDELLPQPANASAETAITDAPVTTDLNFIISHSLIFLYENSH